MVILLKIMLGIFSIASIVFGNLVYREFKLFNKDLETKSTSLGERILVNGIILIVESVLLLILLSCLALIFSGITVTLPFS